MSSDLVIVYHRQPYEEVEVDGKIERRENKSPNGIVPTLKSFFGRVGKGAWVAWKLAEDPAHPGFETIVEIEDSFGKYTVSRLPLTAEQVSSFYHVTSKEAFWPILHSFKDKYNYDPVDWPTFREVNWAFAEAAAQEAAEGAVVWVHDYNLWLVPAYLRRLRPDVKIAFFHHTPFPSADMFNVLPWRREIIGSLLQCDYIGFHIPRQAENFVDVVRGVAPLEVVEETGCAPRYLTYGCAVGLERMATRIKVHGREIGLGAHPVGLDVDRVQQVLDSEVCQEQITMLRKELEGIRVVLSVERLDYTKGTYAKLLAFEALLEAHPELIGKVSLITICVPAAREMTIYAELLGQIEQAVGRINGRFSRVGWTPVQFFYRAVPFDQLVAYYLMADVMWITPLRDGLNLVAKEYAAARRNRGGVLVLSEFTGASVVLDGAVLTNPYSNRRMDEAIESALEMDEDEQRDRMSRMTDAVESYTVRDWADEQMSGLSPTSPQ